MNETYEEILDIIRKELALNNGVPPTLTRIAKLRGKSISGTSTTVRRMIYKGLLSPNYVPMEKDHDIKTR